MKRRIKQLGILPVILILSGCSVDKTFLSAADMFVNQTVGPEYESYVTGDVVLTEAEKQVRLNNVHTFRAAVAEGLK